MKNRSMHRSASQRLRNGFCLGLSVVLLAVLCIGWMLPSLRKLSQLRAESSEAEALLERQRIFTPLLAEAHALRGTLVVPETYKRTVPEPMGRDEITQLPQRVDQLAAQAGVDIHQTIPKHVSFEDGRKFLIMDVTGEGRFMDLRDFVIQLNRMPPFESLESMNISRGESAEVFFALKTWLALE